MDESLLPLWRTRVERADRCARLLRGVPFVRLVGLNGSLLTGTMRRESDIDFYIATAKDRLYTTRLLVTVVVHLTGWRRYKDKVRGRICLNRFATIEALDITPHNEYHARVFSGLAPLFSVDGAYEKYVTANAWMKSLQRPVKLYPLNLLPANLLSWLRRGGEWLLAGSFGDILEQWLGNWQRRRILADPRTNQPGSRVFVREHELCFHANKYEKSS